jgi:hypothetical protein
MKRLRSAASWLSMLATAALWACEAPPVMATSDARQQVPTSRIEGEVVVQTKARGNVVLFLFDASRPPPPQGRGRPVSFTVIPASALFGEALLDPNASGPFTAQYTFSLVREGSYTIRGFLDRNDCLVANPGCKPSDFIPWYSVTSEANAQDLGGGVVDAATKAFRTIDVLPGADGRLAQPRGVNASFADASAFPGDRPAFAPALASLRVAPGEGAKTLELNALPLDSAVILQRKPAFLVRPVDDNGDGVPDDKNGDGIPEFWPKVLVRKLAAGKGPTVDENDLDRNGILDTADFVDYDHSDASADGKADLVALEAQFDVSEHAPAFKDAGTGAWLLLTLPVQKLKLVVVPSAVDLSTPTPGRLKSLPSGSYSVTLIQFTGQTWRLPNELSRPVAEAVGLPPVDSQGFTVQVP